MVLTGGWIHRKTLFLTSRRRRWTKSGNSIDPNQACCSAYSTPIGIGNPMELRQRQPRVRNERYLRWLRERPCCLCGGIDTEAAHIRSSSERRSKRSTGGQEKPSDQWALPLCNRHHREQHGMNELEFWEIRGINPFDLALSYFSRFEGLTK